MANDGLDTTCSPTSPALVPPFNCLSLPHQDTRDELTWQGLCRSVERVGAAVDGPSATSAHLKVMSCLCLGEGSACSNNGSSHLNPKP